MTTSQRSTVVGVFDDRAHAQQAVKDLRQAGFREDQIGVVARDGEAVAGAEQVTDKGSHVATGAATGVAAGAGIGALWALGIAAGILPGIGPVISGGILASVLASAAGGAAIAGVAGALIGLGIPEHEAQYYENEFQQGRVLVTVKANGRYDEAWAILQRHGAYNVNTAGSAHAACTSHAVTGTATATAAQATGTAAAGAVRAGGGQRVEVREEQLQAHKRPVEAGEVRVRKEVHTEQQTVNVPVTREEVIVERHPASGRPTSGDIRPGEEIRVPVKEERVEVTKQPVVKEEVTVGKRVVHETEPVSGTVRKEEVKVEREGDVNVRGDIKGAPRDRK